jgi:DNA-directed RNA polymerase subunit alpha
MEQTDTQQLLADLMAKDTWTTEDHDELLKVLFETTDAPRKLMQALGKLEADAPSPTGGAAVKIGIARFVLCRFGAALEALAAGTDNKDRRHFQALCLLGLRRYDDAIAEFERVKSHGGDADGANLRIAEAHVLAGRADDAAKILKPLAKRCDESAFFHYVTGFIREAQGAGAEAVEAYEQARTLDPACGEATFRLAYYLDLHGEEEAAIDLYEECIAHPPVHANALLNLAVLYDDDGDYDRAAAMARRVLAVNPNHARAGLILKDALASKVMFYDEEQARRQAVRNAVLETPVTDFELSVRARNCLKKMDIRTLGDLVRTTEVQLMSYKNFGETSLREIKEMLAPKGLTLGQGAEQPEITLGGELISTVLADTDDAADASNAGEITTAQVEFSVRVRRALDTLGIATLGDLAAKSEADLMNCPNFGQTSLNEIHAKLSEHGLTLAEG